ncbi:SDR family oxidoreductase [Draconibacterium sp.]
MESKNILITGASGNIGTEIIRGLKEINSPHKIFTGDFNIEKSKKILSGHENLQFRRLDFTNPSTFDKALENIDIVFLLRPPQLADVPKYFAPFTAAMKQNGISKIVFLSVQGVENQRFIPHHKLEKLIVDNGFEYAFLRPGYFMQNLATTLVQEIRSENKIFIPSGNLKFNWVDARDIGMVGAHIMNEFEKFKNKPYEITGPEFVGFEKVAQILSRVLGKTIQYESPSLMKFFRSKRKLGISKPMIFVMIMLHYLPRLGKNLPRLTNTVKEITGKQPSRIEEFIEREKGKF